MERRNGLPTSHCSQRSAFAVDRQTHRKAGLSPCFQTMHPQNSSSLQNSLDVCCLRKKEAAQLMTYETWLAFVVASAIVVLIPGPAVVLTVSYAIREGKHSGMATVPGVVLGAFFAMSLSLAGAGAVLATSAFLFTLLKLIGAIYLIWLAYSLWTAPVKGISVDSASSSEPLTGLVNPAGPIFQQFAVLTATFLAVATLNSLFWLFSAHGLRTQFRKPIAMRILNRMGASCLFIAGVFTARASRSA